MKINKMILIFALAFILSSTTVFAFIHGSLSGFFRSPYVIFIANTLIIWIIFLIAQSFIIKSQDAKVKVIVWIATLALAVFIAWNIAGPPGSAYLWEAGWLAQYLGWKFIVNLIIIGTVGYFGLGFAGVNPTTTQGKIGMALIVLLFAGIIANELGDEYIWGNKNTKAFWDYLFEKDKIVSQKKETDPKTKQPKTVDVHEGGILRPEGPPEGQYRLWVFIGSALIFSWFFIAFGITGNTPGSGKLSYIMAIIIAANLAHKGTDYQIMIKVAEVFFFLILIKQIPPDVGGFLGGFFGPLVRWGMAALLTSFIFCTVFQQSYIIGLVGNPLKEAGIDITTYTGCGDIGPVDKAVNEKVEAAKKAAEKAAGDKGHDLGDVAIGVGIAIVTAILAGILWWFI